MNNDRAELRTEAAPGPLAVMQIVGSAALVQALHVAAKIGLPDAIAGGAVTVPELASTLAVDPDALLRVLRALAALGICTEADPGVFALTSTGNCLRSDAPDSMRAFVQHWCGTIWPMWTALPRIVRTGRHPRELVGVGDPFNALSQHTESARTFNDAMVEISRLASQTIVAACDLSGVTRLMDVGGGYGDLLIDVLMAFPSMHGVLFDRPDVIAAARERAAASNIADRCDLVAGSFFDAVPAGADALVLKSVLHDWPDDRACQILRNCRRALPSNGKLLVVERIMPDVVAATVSDRIVVASDLGMMVAAFGRERTIDEYQRLLTAEGFAPSRVNTAGFGYSVIEARGV